MAYKGPPTIFFTLSSADMHWPELHQLFSSNLDDLNSEERQMNVINNPHLVDQFFTKHVQQFIKVGYIIVLEHSGTGTGMSIKLEEVSIVMA